MWHKVFSKLKTYNTWYKYRKTYTVKKYCRIGYASHLLREGKKEGVNKLYVKYSAKLRNSDKRQSNELEITRWKLKTVTSFIESVYLPNVADMIG